MANAPGSAHHEPGSGREPSRGGPDAAPREGALPARSDGRATLSVAITCRDNERTIERTLASVAPIADEIVALDSGSTDGTVEILERHAAIIHRVEWSGYVSTKQRAMDACRAEWILCLDSDESPDETLVAAIDSALRTTPAGVDAFRMNRKVWYLGGYLDHAWQPEWRLRLARAGAARQAGRDPHDRLELLPGRGRCEALPGTLRHDSFETIADHLRAQVRLAQAAADQLASEGARGSCAKLVFSPGWAFVKQVALKSAWRDGPRGWAAAGSTALGTLAKHVLLIEATRCRRR